VPRRSTERSLEARLPGYRFGFVLLLVFATFVCMSVAAQGAWIRILTVALQGVTLIAAFLASRVGTGLMRVAVVVAIVAVGASLSTIRHNSSDVDGTIFLLNALIVAGAPVVIATSVWRRRTIDIQTVLAALCIYVLIGMFFTFVYFAASKFGSRPFFAQQKSATTADCQYFSFATLTTVGYGDLTAAGNLGRATANLEALFGQLYLVTVIAMLVSRFAAGWSRSPKPA
jgi:Ion channel